MRRLIINADDFGLTAGVNRGVLEAHEHGIVTSTSLMANGPQLNQAVQLAKSEPGLSVGCHVVLVDGRATLDAGEIPSLISSPSKNSDDVCFRESWSGFAVAALRGQLAAQEIELEATAQIRKIQSAGIVVSHLDTHKHAHVFPRVLLPLLRAATSCGVTAIRNPFETLRIIHLARRPGIWKRWLAMRTLNRFAAGFRKMVRTAGMLTPDGCVGIVATGGLDESVLPEIVRNLPEGIWELVCHPGYVDDKLRRVPTRLRESRAQELRLLTAPETRELFERNGIELISYRDL